MKTDIKTTTGTLLISSAVARKRAITGNRLTKAQKGIVLITVVLFLVVLAALGASAMKSARMQERMSGVFYDRSVALSSSDAALSDAFEYLQRDVFEVSSSSKIRIGEDYYATPANDGLSAQSWVASNFDWLTGVFTFRLGAADSNTANLSRVKDNPAYVIDRFTDTGMSTTAKFQVYRVTARAGGGRSENSIYAHILYRASIPEN